MKKIIALLLVVVLTAAISIAGTIAYLQDDDSDVNTMTLGNVNIDQIEQERNASGALVDFKQDKPLYPAVYPGNSTSDSIPWANEDEWLDAGNEAWRVVEDNANVVDKFVTVKNTGKSDAYVRTIIAFEGEVINGTDIHVVVNGGTGAGKNGIVYEFIEDVMIDGVRYDVIVFTYQAAVQPNKTTVPSLKQVYMDHTCNNEDVKKYGVTYDILVLSQAVQTAGFTDAASALNTAFGGANKTNVIAWFDGVLAAQPDTWDGNADTTWYDPDDTTVAVYNITTAEQVAGLSELIDDGETFEGKTLKLDKDIDLAILDDNGEPVCFDPIGSYRNDKAFKGTFDGQGHTIKNLHQNTWALDNGYYYTDCGLGLFGALSGATVKNLNLDGVSISGESAICGAVAAYAENTTFENIKISNTNVADYQYFAGGMVGWASGENSFIGCVVDETTTVAGQWGDFDNSNGGIIGGIGSSAEILLKDCTVSCRIDAYNDVTSSYQWYAYRRSGMLIGNTGITTTEDGRTVASAPQLTCENVTVIYEDWANYTYCEFAGTSWPYVRVQEGVSNSAYSNPRYGHPTDANGNEVVDANHAHNDGEEHLRLIAFNQLYGGDAGDRYCTYGTATHDGVTVIYNN